VAAIRRNAAHNGGAAAALVRPMQGDARLVMYQARPAAHDSGRPACMQGRVEIIIWRPLKMKICALHAPNSAACTRLCQRGAEAAGLHAPQTRPERPPHRRAPPGPCPTCLAPGAAARAATPYESSPSHARRTPPRTRPSTWTPSARRRTCSTRPCSRSATAACCSSPPPTWQARRRPLTRTACAACTASRNWLGGAARTSPVSRMPL